MKTIMCFGTFDLLHLGHLHYFRQAKTYGDYLVVVIARDTTKWRQKKKVIFNEKERQQLIQSLKMVDEAVLGYPGNHLKIIQERKPDVICLGYDHAIKENDLRKKLAALGLSPQVMRMKPYQPGKHKGGVMKRKFLSLVI